MDARKQRKGSIQLLRGLLPRGILAFIVWVLLNGSLANATELEQWIYDKLLEDEKLLAESIARENGRDIALLESSKWYMPLFPDVPESIAASSDPAPPGGYLLRIQTSAATFYALSSGYWERNDWFSPELNTTIEINPFSFFVNHASEQKWSYATRLDGFSPELRKYDIAGMIVEKMSFDIHDTELQEAIDDSIIGLGEVATPVVEKILLSEFLTGDPDRWRAYDPSQNLNLRNQHMAEGEGEHVKSNDSFTRSDAKLLLIKKIGIQPNAIEEESLSPEE